MGSFRTAVTAALALSLTAAACTADGNDGNGRDDGHESRAAQPRPAPLQELPEIPVSGDPLGESGGDDPGEVPRGTRPVAEVRLGKDRLVAYVDAEACALVVDAPKAGRFSLRTAWPKDDSDASTDSLPGGPYARSSTSGHERRSARAQLSCGERAMVVTYDVPGALDVSGARGAVSVVRPRKRNVTLVVVGPEDVRARIMREV
ncbi:hypothetical protein [Streptomyces alboflavus]|uniref:hypothetical protein n=1 Tax=Streptomyces alboflavus TaxID=67267 RepID=UPI00131E8413|nr:hypothetical protein [Streptomyces alboflavus]